MVKLQTFIYIAFLWFCFENMWLPVWQSSYEQSWWGDFGKGKAAAKDICTCYAFSFGLAFLVLLLFLTASRATSWAMPFLLGFLFLTVRFDDGGGAFCYGEIFIKLWIGVGFVIGCGGISGGVIGYGSGGSGDSGCSGGSGGGGYTLSSVLLLFFFFTVRFLAWGLFCLSSSGEFKISPSPPFFKCSYAGYSMTSFLHSIFQSSSFYPEKKAADISPQMWRSQLECWTNYVLIHISTNW